MMRKRTRMVTPAFMPKNDLMICCRSMLSPMKPGRFMRSLATTSVLMRAAAGVGHKSGGDVWSTFSRRSQMNDSQGQPELLCDGERHETHHTGDAISFGAEAEINEFL